MHVQRYVYHVTEVDPPEAVGWYYSHLLAATDPLEVNWIGGIGPFSSFWDASIAAEEAERARPDWTQVVAYRAEEEQRRL